MRIGIVVLAGALLALAACSGTPTGPDRETPSVPVPDMLGTPPG
jgi:hypothetical protein